jgi:hypothetical protein
MTDNKAFGGTGDDSDRQQKVLIHDDEQSPLVYGTFRGAGSASVRMDIAEGPDKTVRNGSSSASGVDGSSAAVGMTLCVEHKLRGSSVVLCNGSGSIGRTKSRLYEKQHKLHVSQTTADERFLDTLNSRL